MKINKIYCGDSALLLEELDPGSIDLTVTSPPYDNLRAYNGYALDFERIARGLYRATKPGGVVVWVVSDETKDGSESGTSFRQALYFTELGFSLETMIYEVAATGAKGPNYLYWQSFEYMYILSKGIPKSINLIKDVESINKAKIINSGRKTREGETKTNKRSTLPKEGLSRRKNIWRYGSGYNQFTTTGHPAPFPEALARDHIVSWSNPGDLVLDPFCGSGTTLKEAKELGRDWIGFDISSEYCKLSQKRVESANVPLLGLL